MNGECHLKLGFGTVIREPQCNHAQTHTQYTNKQTREKNEILKENQKENRKRKENQRDKYKPNDKMMDLEPTNSTIMLDENGLNSAVKGQRLSYWIKITNGKDPTVCCLQEMHLKYRD